MKIKQQINLQNVLDPFTFLEVSQALREIQMGELLELTYSGAAIPDKLFKILPANEYKIVKKEFFDDPKQCKIIIKRSCVTTVEHNVPTDKCDCR